MVHSDSECDRSPSPHMLLPAATRSSTLFDDSDSTTPLYSHITNHPKHVPSGLNISRSKKKPWVDTMEPGDDSSNRHYLTPEELEDILCESLISFTLYTVCISPSKGLRVFRL